MDEANTDSHLAEKHKGWRVAMVHNGRDLRVSAPEGAWSPFTVGDQLMIFRDGSHIVLTLADETHTGVKLSKPTRSDTTTLTMSAKKLGFKVPNVSTWMLFEPSEVDRIAYHKVSLDCQRFGITAYEHAAKTAKPKKPKMPFKFNGTITGELPKAIGLINRCVDDGLVGLDIDEKGKLVVAASIVIEGE